MNNITFKTAFGEDRTLEEVLNDIFAYINEDISKEYKVIVGTDAQVYSKRRRRKTVYATVVVCHRKGAGGRFWISKEEIHENISIRERLVKEVGKMINVVTLLQESGIEGLIDPDNFEVHLDIGHNGRSREVIQECVGWVQGMGLNYKIKPDAWAATHCADHYVR